ncbi:MAG: SDR family oxidoreductase [Mucilaginibacter sp.]|jgi:NAD(P)-dependent dehydrogenase (short-subunit alcohol dehydrogenase family)|uniref:SDR family oxidoreductase n=1 Tax=Mucilaginibacter sp. TaxID=1882438 RepID=UPI0035652F8E
MKKLENKVAVITGATSGMALATAKLFVAEGAYVFITGRRQKELDEAVSDIGSNVTGVLADSSNLDDLDRLIATVKSEKGHIDVVFSSAGGADFMPLGEVSEESFDKQFNLNAKGTFFTVQKALPLLRDHASIIMTGTIATIKGMPNLSVYGASKAGLLVYAKSWTNELKSRGIRVNVLSPGPIETAVFQGNEDMKAHMASQVPMGRLGQPEEIATTALFLASADSSFITGSEICVDGGMAQV